MGYNSDSVGTVSVGTSAIAIGGTVLAYTRAVCTIYNDGSGTVWLGPATSVAAGAGFPLAPASTHHWFGPNIIYGISAGTNTVYYHQVLE
jgi:hypothetical protein